MQSKGRVIPPEPPKIEITNEGNSPVEILIWRVILVLLCLGLITVIVGFLTI